MSVSFGFGLCRLLDGFTAEAQIDICARFAELGLVPFFHEVIDGRVARFHPGGWAWLDEGSKIVELHRAGAGSAYPYDAFELLERRGLIVPNLIRTGRASLEGTPLDALPVSDMSAVLGELARSVEGTGPPPRPSSPAPGSNALPPDRAARGDRRLRHRLVADLTLGLELGCVWSAWGLLRLDRRTPAK